jgi:hypothetical protein
MEGTEDDTMITGVAMLQQIPGMPQTLVQQIGSFCGVRSTVFEVEVRARVGEQERVSPQCSIASQPATSASSTSSGNRSVKKF